MTIGDSKTGKGANAALRKNSVTLKITGNPVSCFARVEGRTAGRVRELVAAISPTSRYCVMRRTDAAGLGLATANFPRPYPGTGNLEIAGSLEGISEHEVIMVPRMTLAGLEATDVGTMLVEYSLPEVIGIDLVLGSTFFSKMKVIMDYSSGLVTVENRTRARTPTPQGHK
ncbi:MAG: hypothetical protein JRM80_05600 [Nitrososphaerota archaeon]|nr:hypothetical protein [Nitrososphaerota archaeon]